MTMFLVLNGMGVAFLMYVLVNFWKEDRRAAQRGALSYRVRPSYTDNPEVFVAVRPLEFGAGESGKGSVIRFPAPEGWPQDDRIGVESAKSGKSSMRKAIGGAGAQ